MSHSTKAIFSKLGRPSTHAQSQQSSSDTEHDVLQLKIENPKLKPVVKSKEEQSLEAEFTLAKNRLENFKDVLRQKGVDVAHYSVSKDKGRITYSFPNLTLYNFFTNNKNLFNTPAAPLPEIGVARRIGMRMSG